MNDIPRNNNKVYVSVRVTFSEDGRMLPREIKWEDGNRYKIDKITDVRQAAAMKAGGQGDRYTIMMNNHQTYLFFERSTDLYGCRLGKWFVERR